MNGSKKMSKVTVVSAVFNINRVDGREWDEYLKWFDITLKLKVPMVLYVEEDLRSFIEERRGDLPTKIITYPVDQIPFYQWQDDIQNILDSDSYKEKMSDTNRIECQQAMYSVIQYAKFPWIGRAVEENHFESEYFFWLDAGGSRFFEDVNLDNEYPSKEALKSLEEMGESFLVQMNTEYYKDLATADELSLDYLYDNRSYVLGSMFGGHANSCLKVQEMILDILKEEMIAKGSINNEQIALGYLIKKYPDEFAVYERTNGKHMDLFQELA